LFGRTRTGLPYGPEPEPQFEEPEPAFFTGQIQNLFFDILFLFLLFEGGGEVIIGSV
jgi:hypothetical protein